MTETLRIVMNGVTGRMGHNQHLVRSLLAIRDEGGLLLADGRRVVPEPVLLGRNAGKLKDLADRYDVPLWSTDLEACLADPSTDIYFDAQLTDLRAAAVTSAIAAGKHVYCEKPIASTLEESLRLNALATQRGVKHGVVQDKLFLPGLRKLRTVIESGALGQILSVRGDFGYWVFEGDWRPAQRPSWNYRAGDGVGIVLDMFPHWRYVLDSLFGQVRAVMCTTATHVPERVNEAGQRYECTADDAAYAMFRLEGGIIAQFASSWATRVNRDELLEIHVDGTMGSAVCGLHTCTVQPRTATPAARWNPDEPDGLDYRGAWLDVPAASPYANGFRAQWEAFLSHVVADTPFPWGLLEGAKGLQLAEAALASAAAGCWIDLPDLVA